MEKKTLDHTVIAGCIAGTDNGKQNARIVLILAIVMFATVILAPLGILFLVLRERSNRIIRQVLQKQYWLQADTVCGKNIETSTDGPASIFFALNSYGVLEVNFPFAILNSEAVKTTPHLYEQTTIGDAVYLLCNAKGKVLYVFNRRFWELDETAFQQNGNFFYPLP